MKLQEYANEAVVRHELVPTGLVWCDRIAGLITSTKKDPAPSITEVTRLVLDVFLLTLMNKPFDLDRVEDIVTWGYTHPHPLDYSVGLREIHSLANKVADGILSGGVVEKETIFAMVTTLSRTTSGMNASLSRLADNIAIIDDWDSTPPHILTPTTTDAPAK